MESVMELSLFIIRCPFRDKIEYWKEFDVTSDSQEKQRDRCDVEETSHLSLFFRCFCKSDDFTKFTFSHIM